MQSPNQQYLIAQELSKIFSLADSDDFNIVGYELEGSYKIAISSNYGMLPGIYIAEIVKLSQKYKFNFYVSDTTAADIDGDFFLLIY